MNKKKDKPVVIFFIDVLGYGGAERLMAPIISYLKKDFSIRVCVFQIKDGNPMATRIESEGVPVDYLPIKHLRELSAIPRLIRYLRKHRPDLVHTQLEFGDILGNITAKILRIPTVSTIHVMPTVSAPLKQRIHQAAWWAVLRFCSNRIIAVSDRSRNHYINNFRIRSDQAITIYNGIDLTRFHQKSRQFNSHFRTQLGIPDESIVLLTVAILRRQKGIQYMIKALSRIIHEFPNVIYLVVGDGPHLPKLQQEAHNHNISEHIHFTGLRRDISEILSIGDIFILPTLTEALPTVLSEAMASKLPIISSNVGGIPEMIEDGKNGLLIDAGNPSQLADACISLLRSKNRQTQMGEYGYELAQSKFNILTQTNKLRSLYRELMNHG